MCAHTINSYLTWLHDEGHLGERLRIKLLPNPTHTFRHCFAINYIRRGGDIYRLSRTSVTYILLPAPCPLRDRVRTAMDAITRLGQIGCAALVVLGVSLWQDGRTPTFSGESFPLLAVIGVVLIVAGVRLYPRYKAGSPD